MTEYFYTSWLVYAAAAIEQGFEGCETLYRIDYRGGCWHKSFILTNDYESNWRFPRTPHNEALMEKQLWLDTVIMRKPWNNWLLVGTYGDMRSRNEYVPCIYWNEDYNDRFDVPVEDHTNIQFDNLDDKNIIIIQRNIDGKPHPFPVWDKECV